MFWVTDLGWLMGPMLITGTLLLGGTVVLFEGTPDYPEARPPLGAVRAAPGHHLGISPDRGARAHAVRPGLGRARTTSPRLRIFGSTGEPWNPEPYRWLFEHVGERRVPIINYTGGTEISGGILACFPIAPIKPCSFAGPIPGMAAEVYGDDGRPVREEVGELVVTRPVAGHDRGLLARPGPLPRDVLVALARRLGARRLGLRRRRRLLVHPRALRRHAQDRGQARGPGGGRVGAGGPSRGERGRRHRRAARGQGRVRGVLRGAAPGARASDGAARRADRPRRRTTWAGPSGRSACCSRASCRRRAAPRSCAG